MMTPFVVGRESSVRALEEALAGDKKIFLATQHDAGIDEPKPNEIYQVGTIVNIVQSLKLPDGNIKVLVEGVERGKILQVVDTDGYFAVTVRTAKYGAEPTPHIETAMQRVIAPLRAVRQALPVAELRDHDRRRPHGRSGQAHRHHRRQPAACPSKKSRNCSKSSIPSSASTASPTCSTSRSKS